MNRAESIRVTEFTNYSQSRARSKRQGQVQKQVRAQSQIQDPNQNWPEAISSVRLRNSSCSESGSGINAGMLLSKGW